MLAVLDISRAVNVFISNSRFGIARSDVRTRRRALEERWGSFASIYATRSVRIRRSHFFNGTNACTGFLQNDNVVVEDSRFEFCTGSAVKWNRDTRLKVDSTLIIRRCLFDDNNAIRGGGVYIDDRQGQSSIEDCRFHNNAADLSGQSIHVFETMKLIRNITVLLFMRKPLNFQWISWPLIINCDLKGKP